MKTIVVVKNGNYYHAFLEDDPKIWDCGKTPVEAINRLIFTYPEVFDIIVKNK